MSLHPEPNVTSCNGVCNARILCVASVPAYSSAASSRNSSGEQPAGSGGQEEKDKRNTPQSYTQQLRDYRKSISPSFQSASASATATPEKKKLTPTPTPVAGGEPADAATTGGSDTQLELNLSSSDDETEAAAASLNVAGSTGSTLVERVPSPAPSYHGHQVSCDQSLWECSSDLLYLPRRTQIPRRARAINQPCGLALKTAASTSIIALTIFALRKTASRSSTIRPFIPFCKQN